jgi:ribonuclease HII
MNTHSVIGIDEVGRGCVAGPVFVAGVKLASPYPLHTKPNQPDTDYTHHSEYSFVRDSKLLPEKKRSLVRDLIIRDGIQYALLKASAKLIDDYGIGPIISHMSGIIIHILDATDSRIIIDGMVKLLPAYNTVLLYEITKENSLTITPPAPLASLHILRESKADDRYLSIALASNIAKVSRDYYMTEIGKKFPHYNWAQNKGYGTKDHLKTIMHNPQNPLLRKTFLKNYIP